MIEMSDLTRLQELVEKYQQKVNNAKLVMSPEAWAQFERVAGQLARRDRTRAKKAKRKARKAERQNRKRNRR